MLGCDGTDSRRSLCQEPLCAASTPTSNVATVEGKGTLTEYSPSERGSKLLSSSPRTMRASPEIGQMTMPATTVRERARVAPKQLHDKQRQPAVGRSAAAAVLHTN